MRKVWLYLIWHNNKRGNREGLGLVPQPWWLRALRARTVSGCLPGPSGTSTGLFPGEVTVDSASAKAVSSWSWVSRVSSPSLHPLLLLARERAFGSCQYTIGYSGKLSTFLILALASAGSGWGCPSVEFLGPRQGHSGCVLGGRSSSLSCNRYLRIEF